MREHFVRFASEKAEQHAHLSAEVAERLAKAVTEEDFVNLRLDSASAFFDFNAEIIAAATSMENVEEHIGHLDALSDYFFEIGTMNAGYLNSRSLRHKLRVRLTKHKFDWIAKFHKLARSRSHAEAVPQRPQRPWLQT